MSQMPAATSPSTIGLMDIGTNCMRLAVVRIEADGSYGVLTQQKELIRLGEGEFKSQWIQPEAMERTALVLAQFADMARSFGAGQLIAVATSAAREARNRRGLLAKLREASEVEVHVISGREEARLIYLGVASDVRLDDEQRALFIDIGGGSTEVIVGDQRRHFYLDTIRLGAIRVTNQFFEPEDTGPVSKGQYRRLQKHVAAAAVRTVQRLNNQQFDRIIGSSGTITTLCDLAARMHLGRPVEKNDAIDRKQVREVIARLLAMPLEERAAMPGMSARRADIIVAGAAILDTLYENWPDLPLFASDRTLRDGLLIDHLKRTAEQADLHHLSHRMQSVLRLGRQCRFDEDHAHHVSRLAVQLFDAARQAGLHDLGDSPRELLHYAAMLHDIGTFVSYSLHRQHSYYVIRHADLLGFDDVEIQIIATTALYHKKTYPRKDDEAFAALDRDSRATVKVLCTLLRLAESLDRSHQRVVQEVSLNCQKEGDVVLELFASGDCHLELWAAAVHAKAFARTFGRRLEIEAGTPGPAPAPVLTEI